MAPDCKLGNLRRDGFTGARPSGKIQVVGGVSRKPFGVDSAGGFFIGVMGHFETFRNQLEGVTHQMRSASASNAALMPPPRQE